MTAHRQVNLGLMLVIVSVGLVVIYQWIEAARTVSGKAYGVFAFL